MILLKIGKIMQIIYPFMIGIGMLVLVKNFVDLKSDPRGTSYQKISRQNNLGFFLVVSGAGLFFVSAIVRIALLIVGVR